VKKIVVTILMIFLSSCQLPEIKSVERCYVDGINGKCYCHDYEITAKRIGNISETRTNPLDYCDAIIGFHTDDWDDIYILMDGLYDRAERIKNKR